MTNLFIPVGIPGCGKSTFAATVMSQAHVISTDAIRESLGDINDQSKNDQVFEKFHDSIRANLELGLPGAQVYADATNLTFKARWNLWKIANESGANAHLIIFTNTIQAVMRNAKRERVVPDDAMTRMTDRYEHFWLHLSKERDLYASITEIGSIYES